MKFVEIRESGFWEVEVLGEDREDRGGYFLTGRYVTFYDCGILLDDRRLNSWRGRKFKDVVFCKLLLARCSMFGWYIPCFIGIWCSLFVDYYSADGFVAHVI